MTNDQWKAFEESMRIAPEITRKMYNPAVMEMTEVESMSLAHALLCAVEALQYAHSNAKTEQLRDTLDLTMSMMSGMYGRLLGIARAYDKSVTAQTLLEAELASVGK